MRDDVDEAMDDAMEHDCFRSGTPLLEGFPGQSLYHGCDAASLVVVVEDKSSSTSLFSFSLFLFTRRVKYLVFFFHLLSYY